MKKKYYILAVIFLCMLCTNTSYGQDVNEGEEDEFVQPPPPKEPEIKPKDDLKEVIIINDPCNPASNNYDLCKCDPRNCDDYDSGDCTDPSSIAYPCDSGDCSDISSAAFPCDSGDCTDPFSMAYPCDNDNNSGCKTRICPIGYERSGCECIKKSDDCKESMKNTVVPGNSKTFQKGDTITFNGPFYFADLNKIPKNIFSSTGSNNADVVVGYQVIEHGNYYEVPSLSFKYNVFSNHFNGGKLGGFTGKNCSDAVPQPFDPNFNENDYGNSGSFEEPKDSSKADPCKQLKTLTNSDLPANDPSGSNNNLLTANINMLKDKLTNFPIPFTGLFYERSVEVKKNNLDFYSTKENELGSNFSAPVYTAPYIIGSIHNHPTNGVALPSIIDLRLLLNTYNEVNPVNREEVFIMVVSKASNGDLVVYNLKINDIDKLRAGIKAVWDDPKILKITDEDLKIKAIKDADADYFSKAGSDKEKAFLQKYGGLGIDLYKSSNTAMDDWGKLALAPDPVTNALIVKKSNCN